MSFKNKVHLQLRTVQAELNSKLKNAREHHREVIEANFQKVNAKKLWDSMKSITDMNPSKKPVHATDELAKANELNAFLQTVWNIWLSVERSDIRDSIVTDVDRLEIDPETVTEVFTSINVNKAAGPDCISAFLLKTCAEELTSAWCPLFQRSIDSHTVPT